MRVRRAFSDDTLDGLFRTSLRAAKLRGIDIASGSMDTLWIFNVRARLDWARVPVSMNSELEDRLRGGDGFMVAPPALLVMARGLILAVGIRLVVALLPILLALLELRRRLLTLD